MNYKLILADVVSWLFGLTFFAAGVINAFWGNDNYFGVFVILLSFAFFPPITNFLKALFGISIPISGKILLAMFIIWMTMGVGELPAKIEIMMKSF